MLQPELSPQEFGFWFEGQWLSLLRKSKRCYSHPLLDTRSAGNIVNPQPSDILSVINGRPVYQECKTSTDFSDFSACYRTHIRKEQAAACRMITHYKGQYVFPFLSRVDHELYLYEGGDVVRCYHRKSTNFPAPILHRSWSEREKFVEDFLNLFE